MTCLNCDLVKNLEGWVSDTWKIPIRLAYGWKIIEDYCDMVFSWYFCGFRVYSLIAELQFYDSSQTTSQCHWLQPCTSTLHFNFLNFLMIIGHEPSRNRQSDRLVVNLAGVEVLNSLGCETFCKPCKIKCEQTCQKYRSETLFFIIYFSGFLYTKCIKIS